MKKVLLITLIVVLAIAVLLLFILKKEPQESSSKEFFECDCHDDCNDNDPSTIDTCLNPSTEDATCRNELIVCGGCQYLKDGICKDYVCCDDLDCDDNDDDTVDSCIDPSTKGAVCQNEAISLISFIEKDFIVDKLSSSARFTMFWLTEEGASYSMEDYYLELVSPSGDIISNTLCTRIDSTCFDIEDYNIYRIINGYNTGGVHIEFRPIEFGHWQARAFYPTSLDFYPWNLLCDCVSGANSNLQLFWDFDTYPYHTNDPIIIFAELGVNGDTVQWADVEMLMRVELVPGFEKSIEERIFYPEVPLIDLNDDGEGYDEAAGDGIYTGVYEDTGESGSYTFNVIAEGENEIAGEYRKEFKKSTYVGE